MLADFKKEITSENISYIASKWIIEKVPFIFANDLEKYIFWKEMLSSKISVDSKAIVITGSASVGFSLNPINNLKAFNQESDVDVAIISQYYFDISWYFLRNIGSKRLFLKPKELNSIYDHKTRLIYWGTIATDKIIQILPFGLEWVKALNEMADVEPTKGRTINIRVYKDFEALRAYNIENLKKIRDQLILT
jgi:hypothetical protein